MADTFFTPQYAAAPWDWNPVKTGIDAYLNVRKSQMDAQENERENQQHQMTMRMNAELLPIKLEAARLEADKFRSEIAETNLKISQARKELGDRDYLIAAEQNAGKYASEIFNYDGYYGAPANPAATPTPNGRLSPAPIANFSIPKNGLTIVAEGMSPSSKRPDGSQKGTGWVGPINLPDGKVASEYSVQSDAVKVNGKRIDFPTLVPTLTPEELNTLRDDIIPNKKDIPEPIMQKAIAHANQQIAAGQSVFAESPKPKISPVPDQAAGAAMNEVAQSMGNEKTPTRPRMTDLIDRFDEEDRRFLDFVGSTGPDSRERKSLALVAEAHRLNNRLPLLKFAGVTEDQFEKVRRLDRRLVEEFDTIRNVYNSDEEALNVILKRERNKIEGVAAPTRSEQILSQIKELGKEAMGSPLYASLESEYTQARRQEKGITAVDDFFSTMAEENSIKFAQSSRAPLPGGSQDYDAALRGVMGSRAKLTPEILSSKDPRVIDATAFDVRTNNGMKAFERAVENAWTYSNKAGGQPLIWSGSGFTAVKRGAAMPEVDPQAGAAPATKYDQEVTKAAADKNITRAKKLKAEIDEILQQSDNVAPVTYTMGGSMAPARRVDRSPAEKQSISRELKMKAAKKQKELDELLKSDPDALKS